MKLPKHANPQYADRVAIAPYNFVPLPDAVITDASSDGARVHSVLPLDRYVSEADDKPVYSGYFDCVLTAETPLYVRGMLKADAYSQKQSKDASGFFGTDDKWPVIPGSSLKGMLRSLVEIASYSKITDVTSIRPVFRSVDTSTLGRQYRSQVMDVINKTTFVPRAKGGYVRFVDGEWYIQPAVEINGTTWARISHRAIQEVEQGGALQPWPPQEVLTPAERAKPYSERERPQNAQTIFMQPSAYEFQEVRGGFLHIKFARVSRASVRPATGLSCAALATSGKMLSKRSEAVIFAPDQNKPLANWLPMRYVDVVQGKEVQVKLDLDYREQVSPQQAVLLGPAGVLRDYQPVFYFTREDGKLLFFGHTLMMRFPYQNTPLDLVPAPLRDPRQLDLAQVLFGYVDRIDESGKKTAHAGRVSITNAGFTGNIAEPLERLIKPQVLSGPKTTTFQHYLVQPMPDSPTTLHNYSDVGKTVLRGHKQYWHKAGVGIDQIEEKNTDKLRHRSQYTEIQPVKAGARFTFRIYFDNLREYELGALAWVLQIGASDAHRLKLGMGKPLGMGSIRLQSKLTLIDRTERYGSLLNEATWASGEQQNTLAHFAATFEKWVLVDKQINSPGVQRMSELGRIAEFLKLLSWPGPAQEHTRYMEIEHPDRNVRGGRRNEYRDRPVLPLPSAVGKKDHLRGERAPVPRDEEPEEETLVPTRPIQTQIQQPKPELPPLPDVRDTPSEAAIKAAALLQNKSIAEGDIVDAVVKQIAGAEYVLSFEVGGKLCLGKLPRDEKRGLQVGNVIRVRIKRIAATGAVILTIKGAQSSR